MSKHLSQNIFSAWAHSVTNLSLKILILAWPVKPESETRIENFIWGIALRELCMEWKVFRNDFQMIYITFVPC